MAAINDSISRPLGVFDVKPGALVVFDGSFTAR